ncbi:MULTISPECIES: hypothetical protein, partial [Bacillus cereus group]|nr:hypothetical protein [Bacillus cereus]MEB9680184.1 hypothetical protein [Bacillus cereus]
MLLIKNELFYPISKILILADTAVKAPPPLFKRVTVPVVEVLLTKVSVDGTVVTVKATLPVVWIRFIDVPYRPPGIGVPFS